MRIYWVINYDLCFFYMFILINNKFLNIYVKKVWLNILEGERVEEYKELLKYNINFVVVKNFRGLFKDIIVLV